MAEVASAFVSLVPSARGFGRATESKLGGEVDSAGKGLGRRLGTAMKVGAVGALAGVVLATGFIKGAISDASDFAEANSKVGVVFGKQAAQIRKASKTSATAIGLSSSAYLDATGTLGNLLVSLDIAPKKSAKLSKQMVRLAGDLASFNNASPEEALDALKSGLTGETEPLKRFGVNMNDATLHAEALKLGLIKNIKDGLTPQTKALAAQSLIMSQTKTAQGDFARTSGGLANQQRILSAQFGDVKTKLGRIFLPVATRVFRFLNEHGIPALGNIGDAFKRLGRRIGNAVGFVKDVGGDVKNFFTIGAGKTALTTAVKKVRDGAREIRDFFGSAADNFGRLKDNLTSIDLGKIDTKKLGKTLADGVISAIRTLSKSTGKASKAIGDFFGKIDWVGLGIKVGTLALPFVLGLATGIINGVSDPVLWKGIWAHLPEILLAGLAIALLPAKLIGPIGRILERIPFVGRFLAAALKWVNDLGGPIRDFGKRLFRIFGRAFSEGVEIPGGRIVSRVLGALRAVPGAVANFLRELGVRIGAWAENAFEALGRGAGTGVTKLLRVVTFIPRKVLGALGDLGGILFRKGAELIQGLINGILSKLKDLGSAMGKVASKIKGFLPGSPVKEGPLTSWNNGGAGKRLMGSLSSGIAAGIPGVDSAMDRLSGRLANVTLRAGVDGAVGSGSATGGTHGAQFSDIKVYAHDVNDFLRQMQTRARHAAIGGVPQ